MVAGGITWRAMPVDFPERDRVHAFFRRRRDTGLVAEFHDRLRDRVRQVAGRGGEPTAGLIDAQSVQGAGVAGRSGGRLLVAHGAVVGLDERPVRLVGASGAHMGQQAVADDCRAGDVPLLLCLAPQCVLPPGAVLACLCVGFSRAWCVGGPSVVGSELIGAVGWWCVGAPSGGCARRGCGVRGAWCVWLCWVRPPGLRPRCQGQPHDLTGSERALLHLLGNGHTDESAGRKLGLSLRTVRRMMQA
ncbi:hypothetical protein CG736_00020 [Kitasatospora sp. CB02891]|nr:hypothetical protein CG736_00020 [Kitasatospora sp. CB02891]